MRRVAEVRVVEEEIEDKVANHLRDQRDRESDCGRSVHAMPVEEKHRPTTAREAVHPRRAADEPFVGPQQGVAEGSVDHRNLINDRQHHVSEGVVTLKHRSCRVEIESWLSSIRRRWRTIPSLPYISAAKLFPLMCERPSEEESDALFNEIDFANMCYRE